MSEAGIFYKYIYMYSDIDFMRRALYLAQKGAGFVAPNPLVGAVLVHENRIIGEGWHQRFGAAHAEVNCISSVQDKDVALIPESTLYVSLEPCAHYGKTPPCAALIIKHKIRKVVIACVDTFSAVAGKGIDMLRTAGTVVSLGVCEAEARYLNRRFFTFHEKKRPFIILKWAQTADGSIAPEEGQKVMLSNALAQRYVHKMRQEEAAILVGYRTALLDDPFLTDRYFGGPQPLRIVLDRDDQLPHNMNLKKDGGATLIYNSCSDRQEENCKYVRLEDYIIEEVLAHLYRSGINSLIVEGGSRTLTTFIEHELWDEAHIIQTQKTLGGGLTAPVLPRPAASKNITLSDNTVQVFVKM